MPAQPDFDSDDEDAGQTIWEKLWQSAGYRHNDEGDYVKVVSCSVLALCSEGRCGRLMLVAPLESWPLTRVMCPRQCTMHDPLTLDPYNYDPPSSRRWWVVIVVVNLSLESQGRVYIVYCQVF